MPTSILALRMLPALLCATLLQAQSPTRPIEYPPTQRGAQVDEYHGVSIADPYRWLEHTDSPETRRWIEAQNALTFGYLHAIPERAAIRQRTEKVWNYPKYSAPVKAGNRYFFFENSGLQNQSVLYVRDGTRPSRVLIDPNTLSADGTVAISQAQESPDGRYMAWSVAIRGSDWNEIRVRDVNTGQNLRDTLKWVKFSGIAWTRDNRGFFYSRYDEPSGPNTLTDVNRGHKVYYHQVGTLQSADELIYDRSDQPGWLFGTEVTDDGKFAVITVYEGTDPRTRLYYIFLGDNAGRPNVNAPVVRLIDSFDAEYEFVHNLGETFLVRTDLTAPKGRIVAVDINSPQPSRWATVIPEGRDALRSVLPAGGRLFATYLQDARSSVRIYDLPEVRERSGRSAARPGMRLPSQRSDIGGAFGYGLVGELDLPGIGTVDQVRGKPGEDELFYRFVSFLYPPTVFRYDIKRGVSEVYKAPQVDFDASQYETRQVFYTSRDGTRIPMFITSRKGVALDGSNPTLMHGYGGFNLTETPGFSPRNLVWLQLGGIYAVPNIRGGGEYGKEWHQAGILDRKQNVFDDFIAAAEYLIAEKYTAPEKLAISGGSNGGLLVGAVLNQRPGLFGAALPAVGVMDMLRFHKFTIGWAWTSDYGSADDPEQFRFLRAYSPLHNIRAAGKYPAVLITTADHDDRVVPGHSFKYAAALQAAQSGPAPVLIRIQTSAGHGAGKPTMMQIEEAADRLAFLVRSLRVPVALH